MIEEYQEFKKRRADEPFYPYDPELDIAM